MSSIWTEKYRPSTFEEIKGQTEIVNRVKAFVEKQNMPHLLFAGPAGVGKTTLALVIAKQLYGEFWKQCVLELNASDERGIDVVRIKVKDFARTKAISNVPFKIIYLDECDALTKEAQQALRRTMEMYANTCRFILSCNYFSKLIDPIKSRCAVFKFKPYNPEQIKELIEKISQKEGFKINKKNIDANHILQTESKAEPKEVKEILKTSAVEKNFDKARKMTLNLMISDGLSGIDIISEIQKQIWNLDGVENKKKLEMIQHCAETEFRIVEGSDEFLQIEALLARFAE